MLIDNICKFIWILFEKILEKVSRNYVYSVISKVIKV